MELLLDKGVEVDATGALSNALLHAHRSTDNWTSYNHYSRTKPM
jgi:hypothetical protein